MSGRYNPSWIKLLSKADRILQDAEIEDIQSILNHQLTQNFNYLYPDYQIIKGLIPKVIETKVDSDVILLSDGQVFVKIDGEGYFVDIKGGIFEVGKEDSSQISVIFYLKDLDLYSSDIEFYSLAISSSPLSLPTLNDPILGGVSTSRGAGRRLVHYQFTQSKFGYPICYLQGRAEGSTPILYRYENNNLTTNPRNEIIPSYVEDKLQLYFSEEQGNFIASGYHANASQGERTVLIQPGEAYIKGSYKPLSYPIYLSVPSLAPNSHKVYLIQMDGNYNAYLTSSEGNSFCTSNELEIAVLIIDNTSGTEVWNLQQSTNRAYTNASLLNLLAENLDNQQKLADIILKNQTTNAAYDQSISVKGTVVEAFNSLQQSDINSLDFNASLDTIAKKLLPGGTNSIFTFTNAQDAAADNTSQVTNNLAPYYIAPSVSKNLYLSQDRVTSTIPLLSAAASPSITLIPNVVVADPTTKVFQSVINNVDATDLVAQQSLVYVKVSGLPANKDNLLPKINSVTISSPNLLGNTQPGSTVGTLRAGADGTVAFQFLIPPNTPCKDLTVSLTSTDTQISGILHYQPYSSSTYQPKQFPLSNPYLHQTFLTTEPVVISDLALKFQSLLPSITLSTLEVLEVYICTTDGTNPVAALSKGTFTVGDIKQAATGTTWSTISLLFPAILETPGLYSIVLCPLVQGIVLWNSKSSEVDLNLTTSGSTSNLFSGQLSIYGSQGWLALPDSDIPFQLIKSTPNAPSSSLELTIANPLGSFTSLISALPRLCPGNTSMSVKYLDVSSNRYLPLSSYQCFSRDVSSVRLQFNFNSTNRLFPIVDSSAGYFVTRNNNLSSSWVSKSFDTQEVYTNVRVELSYFLPKGNSISVAISSNDGETWDPLTSPADLTDSSLLIDGNIPLYRGEFIAENLSNVVQSSSSGEPVNIARRSLRIRVSFALSNLYTQPYVQQLTALTY